MKYRLPAPLKKVSLKYFRGLNRLYYIEALTASIT
jgi:hypothetical protein